MFGRRTGLALALGLGLAVGGGCARHAATPAVSAAALLPAETPGPGPEYRLQASDEIDVKFPYQPELGEHVPIRPDGRISLPSTGQMDVVGLTPHELEELIVERSSAHLRNPEVVVVVTKVGEQRVYVGGEVEKPGYVPLRVQMTPLQAVLQSGGFRKTAKLESVLLLTPGADGRFSAARVDMAQVVKAGVPERVRLHPNDVIYVPPSWIADMDEVIDQYVRGLFPALPRVGVGHSL